MACQQPSDGAAPGVGQLLSGEVCGPDALTWPLQLRVKTATSATMTACVRRTRMRPRYPRLTAGREVSGGSGLERAHLIRARTDDSGRGLRHLVPGAGEVAERFGDHQPSLLTQAVQDLNLGVELTQRCNVGGEVERPAFPFAGVAEGPDGFAIAGGNRPLEWRLDAIVAAHLLHKANGAGDRTERIVGQTEPQCQEEQRLGVRRSFDV